MNNEDFSINNKPGVFNQYLIKHTLKKLSINSQINDLITLNYNELEEVPFQVYNENPKKLSLKNQFKFYLPIQNFIIYQYSLKANTFLERKLLKTTKSTCCRNMITVQIKNFSFCFLMTFFFVGHPGLIKHILAFSIIATTLFSKPYWWFKNNRNIMLNFQINSHFKLGRETKEFICFIENDGFGMLKDCKQNKGFLASLLSSNVDKEKEDQVEVKKDEVSGLYFVYDKNGEVKAKFSRHPLYYKKFFAEEIYDIQFEKEDQIVDYLNMDLDYDYHKEYLRKLSKSQNQRDKNRDLLNMIK